MRIKRKWFIGISIFLSLLMTACENEKKESEIKPAIITEVEDSDLSIVTLTADAAKKIALETTLVQSKMLNLIQQKVVPYSALIYGNHGETWIYRVIKPLSFVRTPITVTGIDTNQVFFTEGPAINTQIVSVGAIELYGAENLSSIEP